MTHSNITDLMAARRRYKEADTEIERRIARYNLRAAVYDIRASIERLRGLVARVGQTLLDAFGGLAGALMTITDAADTTK